MERNEPLARPSTTADAVDLAPWPFGGEDGAGLAECFDDAACGDAVDAGVAVLEEEDNGRACDLCGSRECFVAKSSLDGLALGVFAFEFAPVEGGFGL